MQRDWNQSVRFFIQDIGNRWGISPNPDLFSPDEEIHKARLREIKGLINSIQGVYTTTQLEKNLREQAEAKRQKEVNLRRELDLMRQERERQERERQATEIISFLVSVFSFSPLQSFN
jgi:hypothetical protein